MNEPDQPDLVVTDEKVDELSELLSRSLSTEELNDQSESAGEAVAVTFTTQDYPVDGLVSRLDKETMIIPRFGAPPDKVQSAKFQRGFVWTKKQMDKFLESLLLGYPIPGIFLVKQPGDNRLLVLDGQQRLETLRRFYSGLHNDRVFVLENVDAAFKGLTYAKLDEEQRIALDNSYMQATIVAADGSDEMYDAIYQIFERLNSGGTQLTPHEIRVALFSGELMDSIAAINRMSSWRSLYGGEPSARLRDHELILRILAMYERSDSYKRPLKIFLNNFAKDHRASEATTTNAGRTFIAAADAIWRLAGASALRREGNAQVNAAQTEAIFVVVMEVLTGGSAPKDLLLRIEALKADEEFDRATSRATADNDSVKLRLSRARQFVATQVS